MTDPFNKLSFILKPEARSAEDAIDDYHTVQRTAQQTTMKRNTGTIVVKSTVLFCTAAFFVFCAMNSAALEPSALDQGYILALMLCTLGALVFATNRPAVSLFVSGGLFLGLKFISVMKERFLQSALMPADFVYFARKSLAETLVHYPHLERLGLTLGIAIPVILIVLWLLDFRPFSGLRRWLHLAVRVLGASACALLIWSFLVPAGPFAPVYRKGLWNTLSDQAHLTDFFISIHDSSPRLPAMSSLARANHDWGSTGRNTPGTGGAHPDIIEVLEESTFNPAHFAACDIPQCHVQMFEPDKYTRGHGLLRTHTFGGGTWVSEFSVFSGMPQDVFGPAGMYAPYVLAPRIQDTFPKLLQKLGYLTIGVYPASGNFINARNAYRDYGFGKFYGVKELGLTMWHTTDAQIFAAARKVYDENKKPGQPIYMMILTLEQHGPHDTKPLSQLPPPFNQGLFPKLPRNQQLNLSTYLARLQASNEGMTQLEHDFLDRPEPTVLVHFGDHLPSFGGLIRGMQQTLPGALQRHRENLTYYMIKSNYSGPPLPQYPMLDIAYLPAMVLRAAGLPENPYFTALSTLETRCGGTYTECPNRALLKSYYAWIFGRLHEYR